MLEKIKNIFKTASNYAKKYDKCAQNPFFKKNIIKNTTYIWVETPENKAF